MILAIDTSQNALGIGLGEANGKLIASYTATASADERGIHDERLAREVERLLNEVNATAKDVARIILVIGPGSFTGLRIGLAFSKGFAMGTGAELVTVSCHEILIEELRSMGFEPSEYTLAIPAYRNNLVYAADGKNITDITLHEVRDLHDKKIAGPEALKHQFHSTFLTTPITLERIQQLGTHKTSLSRDEISALEPLYITDFTPNLPSR